MNQKLKLKHIVTEKDIKKSQKQVNVMGCPFCPAKHSIELITQKESMEFRKITFSYYGNFYRCKECNREFVDTTVGDFNLNQIRKQYNKKVK